MKIKNALLILAYGASLCSCVWSDVLSMKRKAEEIEEAEKNEHSKSARLETPLPDKDDSSESNSRIPSLTELASQSYVLTTQKPYLKKWAKILQRDFLLGSVTLPQALTKIESNIAFWQDVSPKKYSVFQQTEFLEETQLFEKLIPFLIKEPLDSDGNSLLHFIALTTRQDWWNSALSYYPNQSLPNNSGETPAQIKFFNAVVPEIREAQSYEPIIEQLFLKFEVNNVYPTLWPINGILQQPLFTKDPLFQTNIYQLALQQGRPDLLPFLENFVPNHLQVKSNDLNNSLLHEAAAFKSFSEFQTLLKQHPDMINQKNSFGYTPLHVAVFWDRPEITALLLKNGADPNATNNKGLTPLHCGPVTLSAELLLDNPTINPNAECSYFWRKGKPQYFMYIGNHPTTYITPNGDQKEYESYPVTPFTLCMSWVNNPSNNLYQKILHYIQRGASFFGKSKNLNGLLTGTLTGDKLEAEVANKFQNLARMWELPKPADASSPASSFWRIILIFIAYFEVHPSELKQLADALNNYTYFTDMFLGGVSFLNDILPKQPLFRPHLQKFIKLLVEKGWNNLGTYKEDRETLMEIMDGVDLFPTSMPTETNTSGQANNSSSMEEID